MPQIRQYHPNFCDGFKNEIAHFSTIKELTAISFVKSFQNYENFSGFALDNFSSGEVALMATYKEGKEWWVVGFIDDASKIDLPKWKAKE